MKFKTRLHTEGSRDWPSARPDRAKQTRSKAVLSLRERYANENFAADHHIQSLPAGGLRHVDGFEEAPIAIGRAGQNQQEGWGQIHRVGISFIGHQSRAQTGQEDRAGLARDRLVARSCSTARPTSRILRSVFCVPAIITPTGAVPGSWHGTDRAQPSNRLTIAGLRSMRRLRRVYVSSSLPASAIVGAVSGVVGISIAS